MQDMGREIKVSGKSNSHSDEKGHEHTHDHDHSHEHGHCQSPSHIHEEAHPHVHEHGKDHIPADKVGIALSFLCLIHCLLGPILILTLPGIGHFVGGEDFHWIMLALVVPVAYYSFLKTYRSHGFKKPIIVGSIGIAFLILGVLVPELFLQAHDHNNHSDHELSLHGIETAFTVFGGLILAYAHYTNYQQCQCKD